MNKIDVCVIYYGKPYQTIVSILTLLKHSRSHINKIYITVEKKQPYGAYGDIYKVTQALEGVLPIDLHFPRYFYNLDTLDYERTKRDQEYRWSIPYQYALENSAAKYLFIMHNDMVFHDDMIGAMLPTMEADEQMAGTGSIGQCWSCPASAAGLCGGHVFHEYVPTQAEAIALHEKFDTPRKEKDIEILKTGRVHPLPECRLNEYACMVNLETYRSTTLPGGKNVCFGGNWGFTADLGTGWFHQMVNQGYQFKHFVLEDYAKHSVFNSAGQGIGAYSNKDNYFISESNALGYLKENFNTDASLKAKNLVQAKFRDMWYQAPQSTVEFLRKIKRRVRSV